MIKGHLDQQRSNLRSTKEKPLAETSEESAKDTKNDEEQQDVSPGATMTEPVSEKTHYLYAYCEPATGQVYTDQTGRFLTTSNSGNTDMLILYDYDSNFIHVEPMKSHEGKEILAAYQRAHKLFTERGLRPLLQKLDNEASEALQQYMTSERVDYQLVPPHIHRRNAAERAIRTFKNHFIAILCSLDQQFPLNLWDKLLPQALITLNLLRGSRINPNLSAWAQVHGAFDYNRTPLAPPGTRLLVHEKPAVRGTWAPHAVDGWYLGPAMKHYRCYRVWIWETAAERIAETVVWMPSKVKMPTASSTDAATAAARDLIHALRNPSPSSPLAPTSDSQVAALKQLAEIFDSMASDDSNLMPPAESVKQTPEVPPGFQPLTEPTTLVTFATTLECGPSPRVAQDDETRGNPEALPRVGDSKAEPTSALKATPKYQASKTMFPLRSNAEHKSIDGKQVAAIDGSQQKSSAESAAITYADVTGNQPQRRRRAKRTAKANLAATQEASRAAEKVAATAKRQRQQAAKSASQAKRTAKREAREAAKSQREEAAKAKRIAERLTTDHHHGTRSRRTKGKPKQGIVAATAHTANWASVLLPQDEVGLLNPATPIPATANAVIDPNTGAMLEYRHLRCGPDKEQWIKAAADEIGRLAQGVQPHMQTGTDTMHFIPHTDLPPGRVATYPRIVAAEKPHKVESKRIRFTVGGDRIVYDGNVSTPTADLTTVKCLLNSVISTKGARFMTMDIKDFYLNNPMERYEYMRIPMKDIPDVIIQQYKLNDIAHNGSVLVEIRKGMYGLPQAGIIAQERLIKHLAGYGYTPTTHTPGLYTHVDRPICFVLTVDDFGVKYIGREHAEHLIQALQAQYTITTDWTGELYCGITLKWDYDAGTVDLSMPGYVAKAMKRFLHSMPSRPQHSPHAWTKPVYGTATQLTAPEDTSAPLNVDGIKRLQEVIGTFLYYSRAIDSTMLVALGSLAAAQAKGTQATAQASTQLLNYAASHSDAVLRYHASDMYLHVHSDASYLSESQARSRAGGLFFLSDKPKDPSVAPSVDAIPPPQNGAVHVLSSIMKSVLSSATEAELAGLFHNAKEACALRLILEELGHSQGATPIQTDNACAAGIVNNTVKQRRSKAIDMRFYWVRDRVNKGQFIVHWRKGADNLADYFTKHHSPAHHRLMRSRYLLELHKPILSTSLLQQ